MKNLEIENLYLVEMNESEMNVISGGKLPWWAWAIWAVALVIAVITEA